MDRDCQQFAELWERRFLESRRQLSFYREKIGHLTEELERVRREGEERAQELLEQLERERRKVEELGAQLEQLQQGKRGLGEQLNRLIRREVELVGELQRRQRELQLIAALMEHPPPPPPLEKYWEGVGILKGVLDRDFPIRRGVTLLEELKQIGKELQFLFQYPALQTRQLVAVGGGFSAGKSEFISSLFKSEERKLVLPRGIEPTTAIPTFVLDGELQLLLLSKTGAKVDLNQIGIGMEFLTHRFLHQFPFNLKEIVAATILSTPLLYPNLILLDTPGYNPAGSSLPGKYQQDREKLRELVAHAKALLWLVPADQGDIPAGDIQYLEQMELEEKPIYIVITKSGLMDEDSLLEVLEKVEETVEFSFPEELQEQVKGISCYDSVYRQEYLHNGLPLAQFLEELDYQQEGQLHFLVQRLQKIYREILEGVEVERREVAKLKEELNQLILELWEGGCGENMERLYKLIDSLEESLRSNQVQQQIKAGFIKMREGLEEGFQQVIRWKIEE